MAEVKDKIVTVESLSSLHEHNKSTYMTKEEYSEFSKDYSEFKEDYSAFKEEYSDFKEEHSAFSKDYSDFKAEYSSLVEDYSDFKEEYHSFAEAPYLVEAPYFILKSSTEGSTKRFKITIDDSGVLIPTEIVEITE